MIIDELISLLGFKVDEASASHAKSALAGVEAAATKLAQVLGAAGLAAGFAKLVEIGHDVAETHERLETVFGHSSSELESWADAVGREVNRSRRTLEELALSIGAPLTQFGVSRDLAAQMSQELTRLAVNLAGIHGGGDAQALGALQTALAGNTKGLKQYGIALEEADLREAALSLGIGKSVQSLSAAERAQVTYQAVLAKTQDIAQAGLNPTEAWDARLQNLRDTIGLKLLPIAERMAEVAIKVIDFFEDLAKNTQLVEVAFAMLAPVAAATAWSLVAPFLPAIGMFTALALIIEDIVTLFQGGDSLVGRFLDKVGGEGTSLAFVESVKAGFIEFKRVLQEDVLPVVKVVFEEIKKWIDVLLVELPKFGRALGDHLFDVVRNVSGWLDSISKSLEAIVKYSEGIGTKQVGDAAIKATKAVSNVSTSVGTKAIDVAGGTSSSVFQPVGDAFFNMMSWMGNAITDVWQDESKKVSVRVPNSPNARGATGAQVSAPISVINNFNGVKPSDVDGRVRDAAKSTGKHIDQQLRDAAAGMAR